MKIEIAIGDMTHPHLSHHQKLKGDPRKRKDLTIKRRLLNLKNHLIRIQQRLVDLEKIWIRNLLRTSWISIETKHLWEASRVNCGKRMLPLALVRKRTILMFQMRISPRIRPYLLMGERSHQVTSIYSEILLGKILSNYCVRSRKICLRWIWERLKRRKTEGWLRVKIMRTMMKMWSP